MNYVSFYTENGIHVGALTAAGILDLTALGFPAALNGVIEGGAALREEIERAAAQSDTAHLAPDSVRYANVVENPSKILCVGLNYKEHARETGGEAPKQPVFFSKFSDTLVPTGERVSLPDWHRCYDYEAELVIVVGRRCYHVTREEAPAYIFGYTVGNDFSVRDCQFLSNQWLTGKSIPGSAPCGPVVVTSDTFQPDDPHYVRCFLNGKMVQNGSTDDMIFNCAAILEYASLFFELKPGDLIFTGTPSGVILGQPKGSRVWIKPGDHVAVEIEGLCRLETAFV